MKSRDIRAGYKLARQSYAGLGINTDAAIAAALRVPISMHCWQADDVAGYEVKEEAVSGGGIMATGNYPGRARTPEEARQDYGQVLQLVPGTMRLNIHAIYAETTGKAEDRDALDPKHFSNWIEWGRAHKVHLDFNPSFFSHPKANAGYTLASTDKNIRAFWIRHAIASRKIAQAIARKQGGPCLVNHWIPDGAKDFVADRWTHRALLTDSLDQVFAKKMPGCVDYLESKLFGIGSEEYVVGSSEYYSSYALSRGIGLTMDMGHYHPTEQVHDKISSFLQFHEKLLLHVSRPMRWDSDHVVIFNDDLRNLFLEIQRGKAWKRVAIATDYFDASINRIAAYAIGLRATRKAILYALLDPTARLKKLEAAGDNAGRLALIDEMRTMPFGAVWDHLCEKAGIPADHAWMPMVREYEAKIQRLRI